MLERGSQSSGHLIRPTTRCAVLYASQGVTPSSLTDLQAGGQPNRLGAMFAGYDTQQHALVNRSRNGML
jgi:hypothetical protein